MSNSIPILAAVVSTGQNTFESIHPPEKMGNLADIGYGGCTIAFAINAACGTTTPKYHLYSALGQYIGPTSTKAKMTCVVRRVRDTKTFATREVQVSQMHTSGSNRLVMIVLVDFQATEPHSVFKYSAPPTLSYASVTETPTRDETKQQLLASGRVTQKEADLSDFLFAAMARYVDVRPCPEGVGAQNLSGAAKAVKTTQDHLPIYEKTSASWLRHRVPLKSQAENYCALSWVMDAALSFLPLTLDHKFLGDAGACSSLDFALRLFSNEVRFDEWHIEELKTITAGNGRTYSEKRLWDEKGNMVASMTQQSILRPKVARL
jgi:acyl-CoA thioesterase II